MWQSISEMSNESGSPKRTTASLGAGVLIVLQAWMVGRDTLLYTMTNLVRFLTIFATWKTARPVPAQVSCLFAVQHAQPQEALGERAKWVAAVACAIRMLTLSLFPASGHERKLQKKHLYCITVVF